MWAQDQAQPCGTFGMPGDRISCGPDNDTQEPKMVQETSGLAAEVYAVGKWDCLPGHSQQDPGRD